MPVFQEIMIATNSCKYNSPPKQRGNIFPGVLLLTFLEVTVANISENHISGFREAIIDNMNEHIVATVKQTLAGIFYLVVRRAMLFLYI